MASNPAREPPCLGIVANSVFPYGYDAVQVLGLPQDAPYRARFDEEFVSEQVKREFRHLNGQNSYYCFRDYASNRLVPIRKLQIREVTPVGSVYYIEYIVKEIFDFPHRSKTLNDQVQAFNEQFQAMHRNELRENAAGADLCPLVLMSRLVPDFHSEVDTITDDYDREARRWAAIAKLLGSYSYFKYVPFLRIVAMREASGENAHLRATKFVLRNEQDYRLLIAHNLESDSLDPHSINEQRTERQKTFIEKASFRLELRADPRLIDVQEPIMYINGEYDINHFYFRTKSFGKVDSTTLTIDYVEKPESTKNVDTKISIVAALTPQVRFPFWRIATLIVLVIIYALPHLYPMVFQYFEVNERVLQDLTILAASLTCFHLIEELRHYADS